MCICESHLIQKRVALAALFLLLIKKVEQYTILIHLMCTVKGGERVKEMAISFESVKVVTDKVALAKKGDKDAFINLIHENKTNLYRVAIAMLKNQADAEDAIQMTIMKAYEKIGRLKKNLYFKTWLIRILINQCNDTLRAKKKVISLENMNGEVGGYEDSYKDLDVQNAIYSLKEELRLVTILFYYEDLTTKEISKLLKIPEGTVRSRLSTARTTLQKRLQIIEKNKGRD
jgi:RNA polymerase sigma-70 factor (ECF subfamily)